MPSPPDASWLSVTGDIWVAEMSRFEASRVICLAEIFQESKRGRLRDLSWLGTGTDGIQTFKINQETANHAASDDASRQQKNLPVKPVLTARKRRLVEICVCFSSCDTPLR